uniref:RNA-directed RNA polymerase L n=1 Tax=Thrips tabaci bunya-like virus 3 TaxID=2771489 RepID=A0A7H1D353_9VIRU|nr:putative RNA dependent RNA polymerase [Thrips tabaci bunya-like virus 3]
MDYETIEKALNAPGPVSAAAYLRKDKKTLFEFYKKQGKKVSKIYLSIHSKIQWGGMREIFSMAVESKLNQQIIEKSFGGICRLVENEMISIPSDRRNVWLHSMIHQRVNKDSYVLSYDYRRWGPHSNFLKYKYMVLGMINILPPSFVELFLKLTEGMTNKRIIIKKEDLRAIYNHFICREVFDSNDINYHADYITIKYPHSFVMGIYNYLSSIFHAGSQLLFRHLLNMSKLKKKDKKLDFYGIAHSDDAQAIVDVSSREMLEKVVHSYEVFNKHLNHMQSNKKCMIDKKNSEVISILRVSHEIVTMLAKLSAGLTITPSYKGYVNEMKAISSKVVELLANGATFSQAYKVNRIITHLLSFHMYGLNEPLYHYPIEVLGTPDEHPMIQLMYGTNASLFKSYYYNKELYLKATKLLQDSKVNVTEGFNYLSHTRNEMHSFYQTEKEKVPQYLQKFLDSDTLLMNKFPYNTLSKLQIVSKLKDQNFAAALAGGHLMNGISYLFRNNSKFCYSYKDDIMVPYYLRKVLLEDINQTMPAEDNGVLENMMETFKIFETISNKMELRRSETKLKPCDLKMHNSIIRSLTNMNHRKLLCYVSEPEYRNLLTFSNEEMKQIELFEEITENYSLDDKKLLAENICQRSYRHFYFYSSIPTDKRIVSNNTDLLNLVSYNSFRGYFMENLKGHKLPELISDQKNRVLIEAIYVIRDMVKFIPESLRSNFLNNFQVQFENETLSLKQLRLKLNKYLGTYYSVMKYQLGFLINDKKNAEYLNLNLPLIWYGKRQQGAGSTWFGEGSNSLMTRESLITIIYNNSQVSKIHLNEDYEEDDLNYFVSELSLTGVENPFYNKTCANRTSDKICIGFHDINSLIGHKGLERDFKFIYPNASFYETTHMYPKITRLDIRKVKTKKGDIRYVRLAKDYTGLSLDRVLNCVANLEWFQKNLNIQVPWFYRRDIEYQMTKKPRIWNVQEMGFEYAFTCTMEPNILELKVMSDRKYVPGLMPGLLECIMFNKPDYLRTSDSNKMWGMLAKQYPASFIKNVYTKWKDEKIKVLSSYIQNLAKGNKVLIESTRTYISKCMNIVLSKHKVCDKINTFHLNNRVKEGMYEELFLSLIDFCYYLKPHKYTKISFELFMYKLFFTSDRKYKAMFYYSLNNLFNSLFKDKSYYSSFQEEYGFPWCLLINDYMHWALVINSFFKNFEKNFETWKDELMKKYTQYGSKISKEKFGKYIKSEMNKKNQFLYDIYSFSRNPESIKMRRRYNDNADFGHKKTTKKYEDFELPKEGDAKNLNLKWYDNEDDIYEDQLDEIDDTGQDRDDERMLYLNDFKNPVEAENANSIIFSNPYQYYFIKTTDIPDFCFSIPAQLCINEEYCNIMANFGEDKKFGFKNPDGLVMDLEKYQEIMPLYLSIDETGQLRRMGEIPAGNESGLADANLNFLEKMMSDKMETVKINILGSEVNLNPDLFRKEIAQTIVDEKEVYSEYEPLGTFITDANLETMLRQAFPKTFFQLLKGKISLTKNQIRDFVKKLQNNPACSSKEAKYLKTLLFSVNVKPYEEFSRDDSSLNLLFTEELTNFLKDEEEEESEEDIEEFFNVEENYKPEDLSSKIDNTSEYIKMVVKKNSNK